MESLNVSQSATSTERCCAQCGRVGTRGFKTLGPTYIEHLDYTVPAITICANERACMKRWPKPTDDQMERMYV